MSILGSQLNRFESLRFGNNAPRAGWVHILRTYQHYRLTGDKESLERSAHLSSTYFSMNFHFIWAYYLAVQIELELGQTAKAQLMLDRLKHFRGGIKGRPRMFAIHQYLSAAVDLKRGKARGARKAAAALAAYGDGLRDARDRALVDALLGGYYILSRERELALRHLLAALNNNADSMEYSALIMIFAHDLLVGEKYVGDEAAPLMAAYARFAIAHGLAPELAGVAERNQEALLQLVHKDMDLCMGIYEATKAEWLLKGIVVRLMRDKDFGDLALKYYKLAEARQMHLPGLASALVCAARKSEKYDLSRHTLERYFAEEINMDEETSGFAYYLLLGQGWTDRVEKNAIMFGVRVIESLAHSKYLPTICVFLLGKLPDDDPRFEAYVKKAFDIAKDSLFMHDLKFDNPQARYVWVFEKEKAFSKICEISDGRAVATAFRPDFKYVVFDDAMKDIVDCDVQVTSRIAGSLDFKLLKRLYEANPMTNTISPELLIALSEYYMNQKDIDQVGVDLLIRAAGHKEISDSFKARVRAALGAYHASKIDYGEAARYYEGVDPGALSPEAVEDMLIAYVNADMHEQAALLIAQKPPVSDRALFYSLRKIGSDRALHKDIAAVAYELVFKSWYDKNLVTIALEHAQADQREWQEFSRALTRLNAPSDILDENILNNAIYTRRFDIGAQKVYNAFFDRRPDSPHVLAFAMFAAYEAIIAGAKPEYETIEVLEKLALGPVADDESWDEDIRFVHYGLSHIYLNHSISTVNSVKILRRSMRYCETDGFIFPIFKEVKDKSLLTPYIEKNQPFIYKGGKGKRVVLFYKSASDADFVQKNMRYIRFGLYAANLPVFHGETLQYMISEEASSGSIVTKEAQVENNLMRLVENAADLYYIINNAIIYESMFKYEAVEEIITEHLREAPRVKGWLL